MTNVGRKRKRGGGDGEDGGTLATRKDGPRRMDRELRLRRLRITVRRRCSSAPRPPPPPPQLRAEAATSTALSRCLLITV
ncbi:Os08g0420133 [Oryza sativa Japonica Group]|nr:Os08g0420133 [Oryza sativa Japonica Group]